MAGNSDAYEARLDAAAELEGKWLPEHDDPECERIARLVAGYSEIISDDAWRHAWDFHTNAYANAMSGGSSLLRTVREIRKGGVKP